jgi:low temperature requirement protein LtrA
VVGAAGFFVTPGIGFFSTSGRLLVGVLAVNPFANAFNVLLGAALLLAGLSTVAASKIVTTVVGTALLVIGIAGLFVIGSAFNILALNGADNVLHFAGAVLLLAVGLGAERSVKTALTA